MHGNTNMQSGPRVFGEESDHKQEVKEAVKHILVVITYGNKSLSIKKGTTLHSSGSLWKSNYVSQ